MTARVVSDLGVIGHVGGILRPFDFTIQRDAGTWNLTGYTAPEWRIWEIRTHTIVANNGTLAVSVAATGTVRYTPGASDPIHATAGTYEAVVWITPPGGGDPEPSALHRFTIGAGPPPS